jgi:hypothetical protein
MPQDNSIGALWVKQGKSGPFYSGHIEIDGKKIDIVAFKNDNSKNPKAPSLRILKSVPYNKPGSEQMSEQTGENIPF